jgi:hypothetical protein
MKVNKKPRTWTDSFDSGKRRRRWVDNIKMDLIEMGWDGMDWIYMTQDRDRALVNTVLNLRGP